MSCGGGALLRQTVHPDCGLLCQEVREAKSGEIYTMLSPHLRATQSPPSSIPWADGYSNYPITAGSRRGIMTVSLLTHVRFGTWSKSYTTGTSG